jgi:hypothetical protein
MSEENEKHVQVLALPQHWRPRAQLVIDPHSVLSREDRQKLGPMLVAAFENAIGSVLDGKIGIGGVDISILFVDAKAVMSMAPRDADAKN